MAGGVLARNAGSALVFLPKQTSNGGLDALLLGCLVERVLAAVTAAGVTALTVLQPAQTAQPHRWFVARYLPEPQQKPSEIRGERRSHPRMSLMSS